MKVHYIKTGSYSDQSHYFVNDLPEGMQPGMFAAFVDDVGEWGGTLSVVDADSFPFTSWLDVAAEELYSNPEWVIEGMRADVRDHMAPFLADVTWENICSRAGYYYDGEEGELWDNFWKVKR